MAETLFWLEATAFLLLSISLYIPSFFLLFDLPSHFPLQYLLGGIVLLVIGFLLKIDTKILCLISFCVLLNGYQLKNFMPLATVKAGTPSFKIFQSNVLVLNHDIVPLRLLIDDERPDIVALSEVNADFGRLARDLMGDFPYRFVKAENRSSYGMAILSKFPFETLQVSELSIPGVPTVFFKIKFQDEIIDLVSLHPATPIASIAARNLEFEEITKWHQDTNPAHTILLGDFNATPYCFAYKDLIRKTHLSNAREGQGLYGSFPAWLPFFLRIPIDHVLLSAGFQVSDFYLGKNIGSDHLPTVTVLSLKTP